MPKTGAVDSWLLDQVPVTYTTYTIREEDLKSIGNLPSSHAVASKPEMAALHLAARVRRRALPFSGVYIQKLNPGKLGTSATGEVLKVPNVLPFEVEKFTEGKVPENPAFAARKLSSTRRNIC